MQSRDRQTRSFERYAIQCGILCPVLLLVTVVLASAIASPEEFTWSGHAISDLGRPGTSTFWLFNGGLVLSAVVGTVFAVPLWTRSRNTVERVGVLTFVLTVAALGLVGVFYLPHDYHGLAALVFFAGLPMTQWLYGTGRILRGDVRIGLLSTWLGIIQALGWAGWFVFVAVTESTRHFAIAELIAGLAFVAWSLALGLTLLERGVPLSSRNE